MTGKDDRWGRDSVGRSAPAFMAASITALPPLTCTASRHHLWQLLFLLRGWPSAAVVSLRPVPGGESAGCVRLQWPVLQAFVCLPSLPAMPTALLINVLAPVPVSFAPHQVCFAPVHLLHCCFPCSFPCAPGSSCRLLYKYLKINKMS